MLAGRIEIFDPEQTETAQAGYVLALQAAQDAADPLLGSAGRAMLRCVRRMPRAAGLLLWTLGAVAIHAVVLFELSWLARRVGRPGPTSLPCRARGCRW
jgi:hypothetical protein